MAPLARPFAELAAVALKVESAGPMRVLDIGAGHGWYGIAIATRNPLARIFGLDSRKVLKIAMENARQAGIAKRYHPIAGDAFKAEFGGAYDLVLAANFTHHFDSAANIQLFEKSRLALKSGGRMVLIDFIPNLDRVSPSPDASFALTLFATSARGAIYTFREYSDLLHAAGFGRVRRIRSMIITASR
jgi:cyclopropane fatty-acyl-phospholipid synthase-like methyltransferase